MLRFLSLSSGSCGNCYFLSDGKAGLLIDAGVSVRRLKRILLEHNLGLDSFQAILVTHDHLDHIRHLGSYCKHLRKPVYTTGDLRIALLNHTFTMDYIGGCCIDLPEGSAYRIPLGEDIPEDACPSVKLTVNQHIQTQFFLMTDAGRVTDEALSFACKADSVVIESNYDPGMLIGGPYTHELKMRICQGYGHLSNDECASAITMFWHPGLKNIFLCHLSENNNTPDLAFAAAADALKSIPVGNGVTAKDLTYLQALPRSRPSALFDL